MISVLSCVPLNLFGIWKGASLPLTQIKVKSQKKFGGEMGETSLSSSKWRLTSIDDYLK